MKQKNMKLKHKCKQALICWEKFFRKNRRITLSWSNSSNSKSSCTPSDTMTDVLRWPWKKGGEEWADLKAALQPALHQRSLNFNEMLRDYTHQDKSSVNYIHEYDLFLYINMTTHRGETLPESIWLCSNSIVPFKTPYTLQFSPLQPQKSKDNIFYVIYIWNSLCK